ncbi:hypothetical protein LOTGIDRAFT_95075, partial [Lottia gigantea]
SLTSLKRGRGGRSSFSGIVATVFGSTGQLGRIIVSKLGRVGSQIIIPYRGATWDVDKFAVCGDLGQVLFNPFHLQNEETLYKSMKYSNVVINLIGSDFETKCFKYDDVHVQGARDIARIAKECGVEKFIHFSALNSSAKPQEIFLPGGSDYLASKYRGELAVQEEFPEAVIFRPAVMTGPEDKFAYSFINQYRKFGNTLPLWKKGKETIKQPVYAGDVAEGVIQAIYDPDVNGKTFEAIGPYRYYLYDIVKFYLDVVQHRHITITDMHILYKLKVQLLHENNLYGKKITTDMLEVQHLTDTTTGCPTLEDLGVQLTNIEDRALFDLDPYRLFGHFKDVGEYVEPPRP